MNRRVLVILAVTAVLFSVFAATPPGAADQQIELAYDDGKPETSWLKGEAGVGGYDAVRFSSSYELSRIVSVKYYIQSEPARFNALILNSDRQVIHEEEAAPKRTGWFTVDLSEANINVEHEFYAAMKWTTPEAPALGADESNPDGRSFLVDPPKWSTYREVNLEAHGKDADGDFMIRVIVRSVEKPKLVQFVTCKGIDETKALYEPVDVTDSFLTTDENIYALLVLENLQDPITATIAFYFPDGEEYDRASYKFQPGPAISYYVAAETARIAGHTGTWRAEAYVNDELISTINFKLNQPVRLYIKDIVSEPSEEEFYYVGDIATFTFVVENMGSVVGEDLEVRVMRVPAEIEIVEVSGLKDIQPGGTDQWHVKLKAQKPGTYEIYMSFYLSGEKQTIQLEGTQELIEEFEATVNASEKPLLQAYGLYIIAAIAVILLVVIAVIVMRRKSAAAQVAPPPPLAAPPPPTPSPPTAGTKFCVNCGAQMPATSLFCSKCGARQS